MIKKYYLDGIKDSEISKLCNCNISTVYNVLKKMNVKKRNKRWTKEQINILKEKYGYKELPRKPRMLASGMNWQNNLKILDKF